MPELAGISYTAEQMEDLGFSTPSLGHDGVQRQRWENMWVDGLEEMMRRLASAGVIAFRMRFSAATSDGDPLAGNCRLNHGTPSLATRMFIDLFDVNGVPVAGLIDTFGAAANPTKGYLVIAKVGALTAWHRYRVTGLVGTADYRKVDIVHVASGGGGIGHTDDVLIGFVPTGDRGESGNAGTPAGETVAGVAEIATQSEVNAGTDHTRMVTPRTLAARLASVALPGDCRDTEEATAYFIALM
ncbi:MAG TPA: hypothetical protein VGE72_05070 [Azospirillum sp.]